MPPLKDEIYESLNADLKAELADAVERMLDNLPPSSEHPPPPVEDPPPLEALAKAIATAVADAILERVQVPALTVVRGGREVGRTEATALELKTE